MKMLDKCSFLELTSGMLYKTFLNMLAAALNVMKSWKLEVLLSLCGQDCFQCVTQFCCEFQKESLFIKFPWDILELTYNFYNQKNYPDILRCYCFVLDCTQFFMPASPVPH